MPLASLAREDEASRTPPGSRVESERSTPKSRQNSRGRNRDKGEHALQPLLVGHVSQMSLLQLVVRWRRPELVEQVLTGAELRSERRLPNLSKGLQEALLQGYAELVDRLLTFCEATGDVKRLVLGVEFTPLLVSKVQRGRVAKEVKDAFKLFGELM